MNKWGGGAFTMDRQFLQRNNSSNIRIALNCAAKEKKKTWKAKGHLKAQSGEREKQLERSAGCCQQVASFAAQSHASSEARRGQVSK